MTVFELARLAVGVCQKAGIEFMLTGAFATGCYGIPRSTKDVDLVVEVSEPGALEKIFEGMSAVVEFEDQAQFDTITWGIRHVGWTREKPHYIVEFFELYDDAFVREQFRRRVELPVPVLEKTVWVPTAEDVVVQKLRWGRRKDIDDVIDVILAQLERLDFAYMEGWCEKLGVGDRLAMVLEEVRGS